ncbi:MAG: hypothetical protein ACM3QS_18685 [Bacteroidota bacterium]
MALKTLDLSFRDTWQELWTALLIHVLFVLGNLLVIPGPPATLAMFFFSNKIAHGEAADIRDFLGALGLYWAPAWRWAFLNILVIGLLAGDYLFMGHMAASALRFVQGLYLTLLAGWLLVQLFVPPFLFEQDKPAVLQALRNAFVFLGKNGGFVLALALLLAVSLAAGILTFMLTFALGGAFVAFAGNHAVLQHLAEHQSS